MGDGLVAVIHDVAERLYAYSELPAVRYNILSRLMDVPYDDAELCALRAAFLESDIVEELYQAQDTQGGWGKLQSKGYAAKDTFPTSAVAIQRCLYIGLTPEDRDILCCAQEYLEDFLKGTSREKFRPTNERVIPWMTAEVCRLLEAIQAYNVLCDRTYDEWLYIAARSYEGGEYDYERERAAQHEVFWTREDRLVPMQTEFLLKRRERVSPSLEEAMLRHHGQRTYTHGHMWSDCPPVKLPEQFVYKYTRRWFHAFNYINQFRGSALYLAEAVAWLLDNRNADGLWDWGTQVKDPWGYFGYFAVGRQTVQSRVVDCTMEVLKFLKTYADQNNIM